MADQLPDPTAGGIDRFKPFDAELTQAAADADGLVIIGPDDRTGYQAVTTAISRLTGLRTGIERTRKEIKAPALEFGRLVDREAERLTNLISTTERKLRDERARVDDEIQLAKEAAERAVLEKYRQRTDALFAAGFVFDGRDYIAGSLSILCDGLGDLTDEKFAECLEIGRNEVEHEKARKLAQERREAEMAQVPAETLIVADAPQGDDVPTEFQLVDDLRILVPAGDLFDVARVVPPALGQRLTAGIPQIGDPPDVLAKKMFVGGFEAFRQNVLAILNSERKFTRAELVAMITNLKP